MFFDEDMMNDGAADQTDNGGMTDDMNNDQSQSEDGDNAGSDDMGGNDQNM